MLGKTLLRRATSLTLILSALLAACGSASDPEPAPTSAVAPAAGTSTPTAPAAMPSPTPTPQEPTVEVRELEGFSERSIVYGNVEFTILAARLANQTPRSYRDRVEPALDRTTYAYLDVRARNGMTRTMAQFQVQDFKLLIDGEPVNADQTMSFLSDAVGYLRPDAAVDTFLAFPVTAETDLAGASLLIGAAPKRPTALPLMGDVPASPYPVVVAQEGSAEGVGPTNPGQLVFSALEATFSLDQPLEGVTSPAGIRANEGEVFLTILVRAEKISGGGPDSMSGAFRLLVDDIPRSPWAVSGSSVGSPAPRVDPGSAADAWVSFMIPADATELALQVGNIAQDPGRIALAKPELP